MVPSGSRLSFDSKVASGNPVSCCFNDGVEGGLSCLLHSCPRALWEQLEDKGMGETPPNSSYLLG